MENYSVVYTDEALQDLRNIYEYISVELKAPKTAAAQVRRIRDEVRSLETLPRRYRCVDWEPWATMELRQLPVNRFVAFYLVKDAAKSVQIFRILYGKRDLPNAMTGSR